MIYTQVIKNAQKEEVIPIIREVVKSGSDIYTDGWRSYDVLAVLGYNHKKIKHENNELVNKRDRENHINEVESYWSWIKRRLAKFNGMRRNQLKKYLLESEWRFNH